MKSIKNSVVLKSGYQNGLIGWVSQMHGTNYQETWNLGQFFECQVARQMCDFMDNYQPLNSHIWSLHKEGQIVGSITLDGQKADKEGSQLRWFITDSSIRGEGYGKLLIKTAISFARDRGYKSIYLYTLDGLEPAASLYRSCGFVPEANEITHRWGQEMAEVKYRLVL